MPRSHPVRRSLLAALSLLLLLTACAEDAGTGAAGSESPTASDDGASTEAIGTETGEGAFEMPAEIVAMMEDMEVEPALFHAEETSAAIDGEIIPIQCAGIRNTDEGDVYVLQQDTPDGFDFSLFIDPDGLADIEVSAAGQVLYAGTAESDFIQGRDLLFGVLGAASSSDGEVVEVELLILPGTTTCEATAEEPPGEETEDDGATAEDAGSTGATATIDGDTFTIDCVTTSLGSADGERFDLIEQAPGGAAITVEFFADGEARVELGGEGLPESVGEGFAPPGDMTIEDDGRLVGSATITSNDTGEPIVIAVDIPADTPAC